MRICNPLLLLPLLCLIVLACGDPAHEAVAHVGEVPVSRGELERYLALNLLSGEDESVGPDELNRVKSRMLDALVDEKRLLHEAERRGLEVSEREIDAHVQSDDEEGPAAAWLTEDLRRHLVRQRLLVQKLQEHIKDRLPPPTDDDIQAYIGESRKRLTPQKRVQLRSLRFESTEDATDAAAKIIGRSMSFADAVRAYEKDPGQGVVLEVPWGSLPQNVRQALDGLQPGQVTRPVEFNGDTYLFQLEAWRKDASQMDEDLMRMARDELARRRRREAGERLRNRLRGEMPVRIHEDRLPFRYVPETDV